MTDKTPEERLAAHAAAIRTLREQVAALTEQITALLASTLLSPDAEQTDGAASAARFNPSPLCAHCGAPKPPGRKALTCPACAAARTAAFKAPGTADREPFYRDTCFSCGDAVPRNGRILCQPCSVAFRVWKATTK